VNQLRARDPAGSAMRAVIASVLVLLVAGSAAGCGASSVTTSPGSSLAASADATSPPDAGTSTPGTSTPGSTPREPTPSTAGGGPSASAPVALDPGLLSILPPSVDGVPVIAEPESFTEALADAGFVANVRSAAFAIAVDGNDLSSGVVARLRPGVYSDEFFRSWRDSYNTGACSQAGGVTGNVETELGGRTVHVASCAGGLLVYHAYLPGPDVVVSLFSLGDRDFGRLLMSDLRP
jgi:hypothetical protein